MALPLEGDLDEMAKSLTAGTQGCPPEGLRYRELPAEQRAVVMNLTIANLSSDILDDIDSRLSHVGEWFEKSRLYEP